MALFASAGVAAPRQSRNSVSPLISIEREVYLMGTQANLVVYAPEREEGLRQLETFIRILEDTEQELSTWRDDSELSRLNRQPTGVPFRLGPSICRLFSDLFYWNRQTGSLFDPAIGSLSNAWGLHGAGRVPDAGMLAEALGRAGMEHLRFDRPGCRITRRREVLLDAGAFGKGEALDRAANQTRKKNFGPWLVDFGGQVMVHGTPPGRESWPVDLAHPLDRSVPLQSVRLASGSLSTSGGSERDLNVEGRRVGHHLNPRDGQPAAFGGSVTVWHSSALVADILSTALFVMGPDAGIAWAEAKDLAACFFVPEGSGKGRHRLDPVTRRESLDRQEADEESPPSPRSDIRIRATTAFSRQFP